MPTNFNTSFGSGDDISHEHVTQYAKPINDLESGAAFYRVASNTGKTYEVDFSSAAIPGNGGKGHFLSSLTEGQIVVFKASADNLSAADLQVTLESSVVTHPIYAYGVPIDAGVIKSGQIIFALYNSENTGRFDVLGLRSGKITEFANLPLEEGEIITADSSGNFSRINRGSTGDILTMNLGTPTWVSPSGGGVGNGFLTQKLVSYGHRYAEITSVSDVLQTAPFVPENGKTYLVRYTPNHSSSVSQLNLANARSNSQDHFCRAIETGNSTIHTIGFSGGAADDYTCTIDQRTRSHDFVWTSSTNNEVRIQLGQPSLTYGEFTGSLLVYEVNDNATSLGWGRFGNGYSWLEDPSNTASTLSGGTYKTGISLDANKTYAFIGEWCIGYSVHLVLRQSGNYWSMPPTSDTFSTASGSDSSWNGGTYYEASYSANRGDIIRFFSPPSTGTFELGCAFYDVNRGSFWLLEM